MSILVRQSQKSANSNCWSSDISLQDPGPASGTGAKILRQGLLACGPMKMGGGVGQGLEMPWQEEC